MNLIKNLYIIFKICNLKLPFKDFSIIFGCLTIILILMKFRYFKTKTIGKYDIQKDQSYTKIGYYLNEHWNIGMAYVMENCAKYKSEYYDIYKIKKWTTNDIK